MGVRQACGCAEADSAQARAQLEDLVGPPPGPAPRGRCSSNNGEHSHALIRSEASHSLPPIVAATGSVWRCMVTAIDDSSSSPSAKSSSLLLAASSDREVAAFAHAARRASVERATTPSIESSWMVMLRAASSRGTRNTRRRGAVSSENVAASSIPVCSQTETLTLTGAGWCVCVWNPSTIILRIFPYDFLFVPRTR